MDERHAARNAARRLAVLQHAEEVTGNVARTCRYYGISRQLFYVGKRRYEAEGVECLRDRSRRPKHCPHETRVEVVGKIIYLRQNYHFGPAKIALYLKRYHDIAVLRAGHSTPRHVGSPPQRGKNLVRRLSAARVPIV